MLKKVALDSFDTAFAYKTQTSQFIKNIDMTKR